MADIILPKTKHDAPTRKYAANPVIQGGVIRVTCRNCGERFSKVLTLQEKLDVHAMYLNNGVHPCGLVQNIFPTWSVDDRELFLMGHLCAKCWDEIFDAENED